MGIIKIMHLCSAHTVCCARKVKRNFRPAHRLKMTSPTGFTYVGHAEAIKKSKLYTYTHACARIRTKHTRSTDLASRNLERRIMTASQVLCFSCIWMELNLRWMIPTMRSISLGEMGRVRDCSLSRFITWVVNSLHACQAKEWQKQPTWGGVFVVCLF